MRHSDAIASQEEDVSTSLDSANIPNDNTHNTALTSQKQKHSAKYSFEMDDSAVVTGPHVSSQGTSSVRSAVSRTRSVTGSVLRKQMFGGIARHTVGLILLLVVVFLWTLSNFLGSSILADASYANPFFLTYMNTSIFIFAMIPTLIKWTIQQWRNGTLGSQVGRIFSSHSLKAFFGRGGSNISTTAGLDNEEGDNDDETQAFIKANRHPSPTSHASTSSYTSPASITDKTVYLDLISTARLSLAFCIPWLGANYFAMACLQYTTVASATILTSTSSIWTLLIGALSRTEKFTWRKLCGVLASLAGIILISRVDLSSPSEPSSSNSPAQDQANSRRALDVFPDKPAAELALGDALALLSAIIYGFYTITLKKSTIKAAPQELHMPTFFGLVGLFNIFLLLPLFPLLHFTGVEPFQLPPTSHIWTVLLVNSIASFASDIMWAYAMVFTSPLLVTVGLSLTIPLSLVGEMVVQARYEGWMYWVGAMVVVGSFVFVEREEVREEEEEQDESDLRNIEDGAAIRSSSILAAGDPVGTFDDSLADLMGSDDEDDVTRDRLQQQVDGITHD